MFVPAMKECPCRFRALSAAALYGSPGRSCWPRPPPRRRRWLANEEDGERLASVPDSGASEDVLVTARRRTERSQDVPIAINAFGAAQIESTRTFNLRDLQQLTPSLVVTNTNPRNTSINIRGLGNNVAVYNDGLEPAVGVYLDGVYLARPGQTVFDLADLEQIEVLRGPQGTLFGKNTSAGAVVVTTRQPTFDWQAGGDASLGNYDFRQLHAYVSGPLTEQWRPGCSCRRPIATALLAIASTDDTARIFTI